MNKEKYIDLDRGLYIGEVEEESFFIKWKDLSGNLSVTGDTRVGKTRLMASMIRQIILKGETVLIIDPKSSADNEIVSWINDFAIEAKREKDIIYINPLNVKDSMAFNPLHGLSNEEIASNISTKINAKDDFYIVMGYTVTFAIVSALEFIDTYKIENINYLPLRKFITFKDINKLSTKEELTYLLGVVKSLEISESSEKKSFNNLKKDVIRYLSEQVEKDDLYFTKVSSKFNSSLDRLSSGDIGSILCKEKRNPLLSKLEKENPIIILQPVPLKYKSSSDLLVRSFVDTLVLFYNKIENTSEIKNISLFIDEAGSVLFPGIEHLFNKSKDLGLRVFSFSQPFEEYGISIGKELNKIIQDNTKINIYMKSSDIYLNKELEKTDDDLIKEITFLKKRDFILTHKKNKYRGISVSQENPKYILNTDDFYSLEINNIYLSFSEVVSSNRLRELVKFGLREIIKYKFNEDISINIKSSIDTEHLKKDFPDSFNLFRDINLKTHTLNVFSVGINKFKNTSDEKYKEDMTISLIATLFHDFGKSKLLRENQIGSESGSEYKKHAKVSKIYIEEELLPRFKELEPLIEQLSFIIENHHSSTNRMKRNNKISFLMTSDHEARRLELKTLRRGYNDMNYREIFNLKLEEKSKDILSIKEDEVKNKEKEEKETKVIHKSNKIYIYKKDIILEIINKDSISRISFLYRNIDDLIYNYVFIHLDNGNTVELNTVSKEIIDCFLNE